MRLYVCRTGPSASSDEQYMHVIVIVKFSDFVPSASGVFLDFICL